MSHIKTRTASVRLEKLVLPIVLLIMLCVALKRIGVL